MKQLAISFAFIFSMLIAPSAHADASLFLKPALYTDVDQLLVSGGLKVEQKMFDLVDLKLVEEVGRAPILTSSRDLTYVDSAVSVGVQLGKLTVSPGFRAVSYSSDGWWYAGGVRPEVDLLLEYKL